MNEAILRAYRSLNGLSIGDAFGQRFFGETGECRAQARELPPSPWFWTDDTEMALAVLDVLHASGAIDRDRLAKAFVRRYAREPNRGYGAGAHQLLSAIAAGAPWERASRELFEGMGSYGNGGAMRVGPIGAYFLR